MIRFFLFIVLSILSITGRSQAVVVSFFSDDSIACADRMYDSCDVIVNQCVLTIHCAHHFNSLTVTNGGMVTHDQGDTSGLQLTIATSLFVDTTASIFVCGQGYAGGNGPGAGGIGNNAGGGGGYGGTGGSGFWSESGGTAYGQIDTPTDLGSGGGGPGGGAVHVIAADSIVINGMINADGNTPPENFGAAGGSGGSIFLQCTVLTGNGRITADGGRGTFRSGGGGGGRIAVYYQVNTFNGLISAYGSSGNMFGGAGTIYTKSAASTCGDLTVDNGGNRGAQTPLTGTMPPGNVHGLGAADLVSFGSLTITGLLRIGTSCIMSTPEQNALTVRARTVRVDSGANLDANYCGYPAGTGPGAGVGSNYAGGGGGYGGRGGNGQWGERGGRVYGNSAVPTDFGSGGGGAGGGALHVLVTDSIVVNGIISANGVTPPANAGAAGGAGGSIFLQCGVISGRGVISAVGGDGGWCSGGGGGGRIAVYACTNAMSADAFQVAGGAGGWCGFRGDTGTVWLGTTDLNLNGIADGCDIFNGTSGDCNQNGIPDDAELVGRDCNSNGVPDSCDLAAGTSKDCNGNGQPDECETMTTAPVLTIQYTDQQRLILRWTCSAGATAYRVYGTLLGSEETLLAVVSDDSLDVTDRLDNPDPQQWTFRVRGVR